MVTAAPPPRVWCIRPLRMPHTPATSRRHNLFRPVHLGRSTLRRSIAISPCRIFAETARGNANPPRRHIELFHPAFQGQQRGPRRLCSGRGAPSTLLVRGLNENGTEVDRFTLVR